MVDWASGVNKKILRSGTSWNNINAVIEDATRSGKTKRRLMACKEKRKFSVAMRFSETEYQLFNDWYENTCKYGFYSFSFPQIDKVGSTNEKEYRFVAGSEPNFSNSTGIMIDCTMEWEEV